MTATSLQRVVLLSLLLTLAASGATHTLTITADGNGGVTRNPTNTVYPQGAVVTLTAVPDPNWVFASWSGDLAGSANPANILMDGDKAIIAHFTAIPSYALSVNVTGAGSVMPASGSYISNTIVSLTATPDAGWIFHQWSGDVAGNANPLDLTMNGPKAITAVFGQPPTIGSQPQSVLAQPGDNVQFNSTAQGSAPLSYQWYFGASPLNGATTGSLTVTNAQLANAGNYRLVVTNLFGRATSDVAVLTVTCSGTNVLSTCTEAALRAAVGMGGHVRVCCNDTIVLSSPIDVVRDTVLDASGQSFVISGDNAVRLFNVATGVTFVVSNTLLANGRQIGTNNENGVGEHVLGGAILNLGGTLKLYSCVLSNNGAQGGIGMTVGGNARGGAIYTVGGTVLLDDVLVTSNFVRGGAPTWYTGTGAGNSHGGAIYSDNSTVSVLDSTLSWNSCTTPYDPSSPARGGVLFQLGGASYFTNSTVEWNRAIGERGSYPPTRYPGDAEGGGIFISSGSASFDRVTLNGNSATGGVSTRSAAGFARGGAIYSAGYILLHECAFNTNAAASGNSGTGQLPAQGGGLFNVGTASITETTWDRNSARGGFGGSWGTPYGHSGSSAFGGGVFNGGSLFVTNSTLHQNSANGGSGGSQGAPAGSGIGGGVYNIGVVQVLNVTMAGNSVAPGAWGYTSYVAGANIATTNGSFTARNTLIAYPGTNENVWGAIIDGGYNISSDGSAAFSSGSSFNFTDPKLLPLADNGGPTLTMALAADSPAIDWAPAAGAPATDQRGVARPYGSGVDLGAFELGSFLPRLSGKASGAMFELSFVTVTGETYELQHSPDLVTWQVLETISTNGVVVRSLPRTAAMDFYRVRRVAP